MLKNNLLQASSHKNTITNIENAVETLRRSAAQPSSKLNSKISLSTVNKRCSLFPPLLYQKINITVSKFNFILLFAILAMISSKTTVNAASIILRRSLTNEDEKSGTTLKILKEILDKYPIIVIPKHRLPAKPWGRPLPPNVDLTEFEVNKNLNNMENLNIQPEIFPDQSQVEADLENGEHRRKQQTKRNNAEVVNHILKNFSNLDRLGDVGK